MGIAMNSHALRAAYRGLLCLALIAIITCVPAHAADPPLSATGSLLPLQQAYLAWMAEETDVAMSASLSYVETLPGNDTRSLTSLHADFSKARSAIGSITSRPALEKHTSLMQKTALSFNRETKNQTTAHQGTMRDLQEQIGRAVNANPGIAMKKDAYWDMRSTRQLDDFDAWLKGAQRGIDALQAQGYPVTGTQQYLDRFASFRPDLKSSLDAQDFDRADTLALQIRNSSSEISGRIVDLKVQVSPDTTAEFRIDEADRVIARAEQINNQLTEQILDIGAAEPALAQTKTDVKMARLALNGGQKGLISTGLLLVKKDYLNLAAAYRDIAVSASLPDGMADTLKAMSLSLEDTADRIGEP